MTNQSTSSAAEPVTPGQVFARQLRRLRKKRGWSQKQLADLLQAQDVAINRATIARIESEPDGTRAHNISVEDLLAVAIALGVNPVELFVPQEADEVLSVGKTKLTPAEARDWLRQKRPLRKEDAATYLFEVPDTERDAIINVVVSPKTIEAKMQIPPSSVVIEDDEA